MSETKVIIIDDEAPARNLLKEYLQDYPQLEVVAECRNGIEAIASIDSLCPDIIFLDIQMPGKNGFEVLQEIEHIPQIIFSTAYDQFALKAFEVNAIDYLLKPYTKERFRTTVNKLLSSNAQALKNIQMLAESLLHKAFPERILVEQGNKLVSVPVRDVTWLEARGDYTRIHTGKQIFISNKGISELEQKLNPQQFLRIHRSTIIAISAIMEVYKEMSGPQIKLQNGTVLKVSRSYTHALKNLIY
jgi:two-component system, LytTR family, response regulator